MLTKWNNQVYLCDNAGKLKFQFQRHGRLLWSLSISNNNDIMIISDDYRAIHTYSTDGDLKSTIKLHHAICKIIVLTFVWNKMSLFLHSYSETGELENSVFFRKGFRGVEMKNHPRGPVAVRDDRSITFF